MRIWKKNSFTWVTWFYMGFRETADHFSSDAPGIFVAETKCEIQDLMQNLATLPALPMGKALGLRAKWRGKGWLVAISTLW